MREPLPQRRASDTTELYHFVPVKMTVGFYDDGRPGEVFLATEKAGTAVDIAARDTAILMSLCLQHGCSAETMAHALTKDAQGRSEGLAGVVAEMLIGGGS